MPEEIFRQNIDKLETIYSTFIKGDTNPQQETELRIELIDTISNLEASFIGQKESNKEFTTLIETTREVVLNWDPYGHWFRQHKELVDLIYDIIVKGKNVVFVHNEESSGEASRLKKELASLKAELNDLRSLMSSLVKEQSIQVSEEVQEAVEETDSLPPIDEDLISITEQPGEDEKSTAEPPILLPLESEEPEVENFEPIDTPQDESVIVQPIVESEEDSEIIASDSTLQKLSEKVNPEEQPSAVLSQMKSIILEAEEETVKQITDFKEKLHKTSATPPIVEESVAKAPVEPTFTPPIVEEPPVELPEQEDEGTSDSWVKPSEVLKQKVIHEASTQAVDPYMQLLTLEAEKYRLEKEIEKNETDFQEGLKNKQEFDESIQRINSELNYVRKQIEELRSQLTS